ncbi:MAG: S9 family peptidase [Chloracidobacterium sp.]|nr:S9 family peptidase [Chloracidobacterium sp.]
MRLLKFFFLSIALSTGLQTALAQTAWTPETQVKIKALGTPRISPDGRRVAYTVNEAVMAADKSEFVTQIWLAATDGSSNYQVTFGEKSSANPKWSPDGSMIAFTSNRKDNRNQIYVMRLAGGEAEQITDGKGSVGNFEWSPDGRSFAFTMTDPMSDDEEKNNRGRNDFRWVNENIKLARLYVTPLAKGADGKREVRKLTAADRHVTSFDWSPDGTRIAFAHVTGPLADLWPSSDVSVVNVASAAVTPFAASAASEQNPRYSPDGMWIAMTVTEMPTRWAQSYRINVFPAGGGTPKVMPLSHDGQPNILAWNADSRGILFTEARGTGTALYGADINAGTIQMMDSQDAVISAPFAGKDGWYAFVKQTADSPPEVFVGRQGVMESRAVSNANADYAKMQVGRTEVIKWKSRDGREIEGLLHYPNGYQAGQKVPLILNIHGGPAGVFQRSYVGGRGVYPLATFMSKGYAILRPNPRGSSGYGTEFRRANIKDWGFGDFDDLMTGVDHVISMGVADPNRLGVMGWSYGGYMTSMIITKTKRFKAASAGAPVTNMMSFNGTADIPSFLPDYFEAEFWDNPQIYSKHSAMFNIKGVSTPTLVQHGEADLRVPIEQGYQLYSALRRQNVPTRMIVLPRQPHGPQEPKMQIAAMQSNLEWFDKYLK